MENERIQAARTVTAATSDSIDTAAKYLEEYRFLHRMLAMNLYEKKYALRTEALLPEEKIPGGDALIKARMFEIRRFVLSLGNCNEKIFLIYHYLHGLSVEKCAEVMEVSRRSAFRIKKRALTYAGQRLPIYLQERQNGIR